MCIVYKYVYIYFVLRVCGHFACLCVWTMYIPGIHRGQKRGSDDLEQEVMDSGKLPCGCWD